MNIHVKMDDDLVSSHVTCDVNNMSAYYTASESLMYESRLLTEKQAAQWRIHQDQYTNTWIPGMEQDSQDPDSEEVNS